MISSGQVTVGTATPVKLDGSSVNATFLTVHNNDNTKVLYLGDSNVSSTTGLRLLKEETLQFTLNPGEGLFAISASGSHVVSWLRQTV
jgi:hypothetical protein